MLPEIIYPEHPLFPQDQAGILGQDSMSPADSLILAFQMETGNVQICVQYNSYCIWLYSDKVRKQK